MREATAISMLSLAALLCLAATVGNSGGGMTEKRVRIINVIGVGNEVEVNCAK